MLIVAGLEHEPSRGVRVELEGDGGEHAREVAVPEAQHVAVGRRDPVEHALAPGPRRRAIVSPPGIGPRKIVHSANSPPRARISGVVMPFELAVVPLAQVVVDDRVAETRPPPRCHAPAASGSSTPARTRAGRARARARRVAAVRSSVSGMSVRARVPARRAPLGLAVADDPELVHRAGTVTQISAAAARSSSRKSGCAISASAAARSRIVRPRNSATPCSVITTST